MSYGNARNIFIYNRILCIYYYYYFYSVERKSSGFKRT